MKLRKVEFKNKSIILMNYQNNQEDECFVSTHVEEHEAEQSQEERFQMDEDIRNSIPQANQLKPHYRPTTMVPRVMNTQPPIYALPPPLNQPCQQIILETAASNTKPKLGNKQKLELAQYLHKKQFYIVYNKHTDPLTSSKKSNASDLTIRLRTISQLSDYDWKLFRQIADEPQCARKGQEQIDSNFQCGNLSQAYASYNNPQSYYLLLEQDVNTHGYTNWFFYRFRNQDRGVRRFYILNVAKRTSFYKQGMKISLFSMKKFEENNLRWHKGGNNIAFFQTSFIRNPQTNQYFNCLYFEYDFQHQGDQVYFALSQPYTYTRMASMIKQLNPIQQYNETEPQIYANVETIGYSISNNIIPSISITNSLQSNTKKTIVILGRQHPAEMAGSFISEYLIKILTKKSDQTKLLLSKFNFVIVPMANPDGVIYGNARSNLAGLDLNRHWGADVIKQLTPQTFKIRSALCALQKSQQQIKFLLDLHGHGKKLNSFLFCCKKQDRISNRYFPLIMSKMQPRFDLVSCTYGISKDKQKTVRAQLYDIGINNCYTFQNSYYGYNRTKDEGDVISYTQKDYQQIAQSIVKSLYIFFATEKSQQDFVKQKFGYNIESVNEQLIKIVDKLQREEKNVVNDQDIMSESDPEGDGLKLEERLKICNNSKVLDKKIRQSYKKNKSCSKQKNTKEIKKNKIKTQLAEQQKQQSQEEDIKILQRKIQSKLVLSKKLKTQNKMRATNRQRKSMMDTRKSFQEEQSKVIKKVVNQPLQAASPTLNSRFTNTYYLSHKNGSFAARTKPYDRSKIYQKIKTQISQAHSFSLQDIQQQNLRKQKIQQQFSKLKNQSLKNMMKESLLFLGHSLKNKKCVWVQQKSKKVRASNHLIQAKFHSFSFNLQQSTKFPLRTQKSQSDLGDKTKIMPTPCDPNQLRTRSYSKKDKRSYHRFQSFVKNEPFNRSMVKDNKGPVFYHFPVM